MSTDDSAMRDRVRSIISAGRRPPVILGRSRGTRVRNRFGKPIPCCWDDCERDGFEEHKARIDGQFYVFCSDRHRRMHLAGHRSYGNTG